MSFLVAVGIGLALGEAVRVNKFAEWSAVNALDQEQHRQWKVLCCLPIRKEIDMMKAHLFSRASCA
ncbi:MAG: hypothetical protein Q4P66_09845 [Actinomycetaceae bacterium]|nr:hypothetical protein [Actinomycetaceae bacterium]